MTTLFRHRTMHEIGEAASELEQGGPRLPLFSRPVPFPMNPRSRNGCRRFSLSPAHARMGGAGVRVSLFPRVQGFNARIFRGILSLRLSAQPDDAENAKLRSHSVFLSLVRRLSASYWKVTFGLAAMPLGNSQARARKIYEIGKIFHLPPEYANSGYSR